MSDLSSSFGPVVDEDVFLSLDQTPESEARVPSFDSSFDSSLGSPALPSSDAGSLILPLQNSAPRPPFASSGSDPNLHHPVPHLASPVCVASTLPTSTSPRIEASSLSLQAELADVDLNILSESESFALATETRVVTSRVESPQVESLAAELAAAQQPHLAAAMSARAQPLVPESTQTTLFSVDRATTASPVISARLATGPIATFAEAGDDDPFADADDPFADADDPFADGGDDPFTTPSDQFAPQRVAFEPAAAPQHPFTAPAPSPSAPSTALRAVTEKELRPTVVSPVVPSPSVSPVPVFAPASSSSPFGAASTGSSSAADDDDPFAEMLSVPARAAPTAAGSMASSPIVAPTATPPSDVVASKKVVAQKATKSLASLFGDGPDEFASIFPPAPNPVSGGPVVGAFPGHTPPHPAAPYSRMDFGPSPQRPLSVSHAPAAAIAPSATLSPLLGRVGEDDDDDDPFAAMTPSPAPAFATSPSLRVSSPAGTPFSAVSASQFAPPTVGGLRGQQGSPATNQSEFAASRSPVGFTQAVPFAAATVGQPPSSHQAFDQRSSSPAAFGPPHLAPIASFGQSSSPSMLSHPGAPAQAVVGQSDFERSEFGPSYSTTPSQPSDRAGSAALFPSDDQFGLSDSEFGELDGQTTVPPAASSGGASMPAASSASEFASDSSKFASLASAPSELGQPAFQPPIAYSSQGSFPDTVSSSPSEFDQPAINRSTPQTTAPTSLSFPTHGAPLRVQGEFSGGDAFDDLSLDDQPSDRSAGQQPSAASNSYGFPAFANEASRSGSHFLQPPTTLSHSFGQVASPEHDEFRNVDLDASPLDAPKPLPCAPHAVCAFGFGGRFVVFQPNNQELQNSEFHLAAPPAPGKVFQLRKLLKHTPEVIALARFPGPLKGSTSLSAVEKVCEPEVLDATGNTNASEHTLWELLLLLCSRDGSLLRDKNPKDYRSSIEAVRQVLLKTDPSWQSGERVPPEAQQLSQLEQLVLQGDLKGAHEFTMRSGMWEHALVLASTLSVNAFQHTVAQIIEQLPSGSSLRTLYAMHAGTSDGAKMVVGAKSLFNEVSRLPNLQPGQAAVPSSRAHPMLQNWRKQLLNLLVTPSDHESTMTERTVNSLGQLGDLLWSKNGDVLAAHVCYLLCGLTFQSYENPNARMVLVGGDHKLSPRTYINVTSIQRTEVLEYSMKLGNSQFTLPPFQVYKFIYALILADYGFLTRAQAYHSSVSSVLSNSKGRYTQHPVLLRQMDLFADRLSRRDKRFGAAASAVAGGMVSKVFSMFGGLLRQSQSGDVDPQATSSPAGTLDEPERRSHMRTSSEGATRDEGSNSPHSHKRSLSSHVSSVMAAREGAVPPSFSQPTLAPTREPPFALDPHTRPTTLPHAVSQPSLRVEPPSHPLPASPSEASLVQPTHTPADAPSESKESSSAATSPDASKQKPQQQSNKPGVFSRFASWIVRRNASEDGYTEMNLGDDAGLYYNKELGMWVMPGEEEAAAKAKKASSAPPSDAMLGGGSAPLSASAPPSVSAAGFGAPPGANSSASSPGAALSGASPSLGPGLGLGAPPSTTSAPTIQPRSQRSRYVNVFASAAPSSAPTMPSFSLLPPSGAFPDPTAGGAVPGFMPTLPGLDATHTADS